jgi:hypothetical protein
MTVFIAGCLVIITGLLLAIYWRLGDLLEYNRTIYREVMGIKRQTFPRISRASMQSGKVSEEQHLARLGRASAARRVVVGGDADSQQYKNLATNPAMVDNE